MYNIYIYFGRPRYCSLFFFQIGKKPTDGAEAISSQQPGSQSHHHPEGSEPHPTSQLCSAQLFSTPGPVWIRYQLEDYDWKEEREEKWKKSFTNYKESKTLLNLPQNPHRWKDNWGWIRRERKTRWSFDEEAEKSELCRSLREKKLFMW